MDEFMSEKVCAAEVLDRRSDSVWGMLSGCADDGRLKRKGLQHLNKRTFSLELFDRLPFFCRIHNFSSTRFSFLPITLYMMIRMINHPEFWLVDISKRLHVWEEGWGLILEKFNVSRSCRCALPFQPSAFALFARCVHFGQRFAARINQRADYCAVRHCQSASISRTLHSEQYSLLAPGLPPSLEQLPTS